jgi:endonuclease/exonuclease/phosphatase family metal-dependent hydrolase
MHRASDGLSSSHSPTSAPRFLLASLLITAILTLVTTVMLASLAHAHDTTKPRADDLVLQPIAKLPPGADLEVSGMIMSRKFPGVLWTLGDSGNPSNLYPVRLDRLGAAAEASTPPMLPSTRGVKVTGASNRDWEDLTRDASGRMIIADVGNNSNARTDLCLYITDEPDPDSQQTLQARRFVVNYPDQTRFPAPKDQFNFDAEALFTIGDSIYILTKHRSDTFTSLYRVTDLSEEHPPTLEYVDRFDVMGKATAAAASTDGLSLAVLTYERIWLFQRESLQTPFFAARVSCRTYRYTDGESDSESLCFEDDRTLLIADEGRATLYRVALSELKQVSPGIAPLPAAAPPAPTLEVASFNMRYASADDGPNVWTRRTQAVKRAINDANPDIIGLQEVEALQADWLIETLPSHAFHGVGRADGSRRGEFAPILYRTSRFSLERAGHFWLSETPETPGSRGWDGACERMASWVLLHDKTCNSKVFVLNTHLDHVGQLARKNGLELIRDRIASLAGDASVIITGDFNLSADSDLARTLINVAREGEGTLADTFRSLYPARDIDEATFNGWKPIINGDRIDWILASPQFTTLAASIERARPQGQFASDHFMVRATIRYQVTTP